MKKYIVRSTIITSSLLIITLIFLSNQAALSDDDHYEKRLLGFSGFRTTDVIPANNPVYKEECGSCHMAYSPGLLPVDSWKKVMLGLDNHFGDNAELDLKTSKEILGFLIENAADNSEYGRSQKFAGSFADKVVDRITQTPYFIRKHDEIPKRIFANNPKLSSFSQCSQCHQNAEKGSFDEDEVNIPGIGRWDD